MDAVQTATYCKHESAMHLDESLWQLTCILDCSPKTPDRLAFSGTLPYACNYVLYVHMSEVPPALDHWKLLSTSRFEPQAKTIRVCPFPILQYICAPELTHCSVANSDVIFSSYATVGWRCLRCRRCDLILGVIAWIKCEIVLIALEITSPRIPKDIIRSNDHFWSIRTYSRQC